MSARVTLLLECEVEASRDHDARCWEDVVVEVDGHDVTHLLSAEQIEDALAELDEVHESDRQDEADYRRDVEKDRRAEAMA